MPSPYTPAAMAALVVLFCGLATWFCWAHDAPNLCAVFALLTLIFTADAWHEWRKARAARRASQRAAPFVRPALPTDDTR